MFIFSQEDPIHKLEINTPFRSDSFAIFVVQKGEIMVECNLNNYNLVTNSVFFALPDSLYELQYISADLSFTCVAFRKDYLDKQRFYQSSLDIIHIFCSEMQLHHALTEEECTDLSITITALQKKTLLRERTPYYDEIVHHNFSLLIYQAASVFSKHISISPPQLNRKEEISVNFLNLLSERFKKERSVQYYADALFITARHLSQVVKEITGKTAGDLIDEAVIKEAKVLLSQPAMNVAQAASKLEFSNQSFFGKYFKHHTGLSPAEYRKNSHLPQNPPF